MGLQYWGSLGYTLAEIPFLTKFDVLDEGVIHRRVSPLQVDIYGHMNNMWWFHALECARWSWVYRCGLAKHLNEMKLGAVVAGISFRFQKELKPLQAYSVTCKLISFDKDWWYLQQTVRSGDKICGSGIVRFAVVGKNGRVPLDVFLKKLGYADERLERVRQECSPLTIDVVRSFAAHDADLRPTPLLPKGGKTQSKL
eukprot:ANDGO_03068.mRNA.1 Uncharacterized protein YBR096W